MMKDVYKVEISAKDCPIGCTDLTIDFNKSINTEEIIGNAKVALISSGDVVWMGYDGDAYKLGDKYKDFNAIISCVYYEPSNGGNFGRRKKYLDMKLCFYKL